MDVLLRGLTVYFFLMIVLRLGGKRTLGEATTFDFVLLLIIAETTQQALLGDDFSVTNSMLLIVTLIGTDILLSVLKQQWPVMGRVIDGVPMVIIDKGRLRKERMDKARVDEEDILAAARETQGLKRLDQIEYAVLERSGGISIIPKQSGA